MKNNKLYAVTACLLLTSCGFEPIYGTTKFHHSDSRSISIEKQMETIAIENIPNREGQYLRNALIDRFYQKGRPQNPTYTLRVSDLRESIIDLDITKESDATRAQLRLDATMTLVDQESNTVLTRKLTSVGSYNILTSEFSTRVSEDNTRENALNDLAQQIELQVGLYLQNP